MVFLEVKNLEVTYLGSPSPALYVEEFSVEEGESVLIVGKSGSGKSTLINVLNGVIPHMINAEVKGEVNVGGKDPRHTPIHEMSKVVGTLLQDPESQVFNYMVIDEIAFGPENFMLPKDEIEKRVMMASKVTGVTHLLKREVNTLSGGELQRVALASILALEPKALILDEPTSNIDPEGTAQIFNMLRGFREERRTLIIVEHKLERVLPFVDRVVLIDNGKLLLDVEKDYLVDKADLLKEAGVEIPDYYLHLKKVGAKKLCEEKLKGYVYTPPPRHEGNEVILRAEVKVYAKGKTIVDTSLELKKSEITALMGNNGAGKTTLLKAIMGILDKKLSSNVRLLVEGKDISKTALWERGAYIAYLPQNFDVMLVKRTVEDEVSMAMKYRKTFTKERLEYFLKVFSLDKVRKEDPLTLSMGQRRRVAMASVLASGAKVVLMD
ncbi:MAG: ATP-binding cassette domain-containing protein, partial [Sulfolobus sp.]|nr:ATP-binding cassette domain-containing protein [Sulfolobus sp.]